MDPLVLVAPVLTGIVVLAGFIGARRLDAGTVTQWSLAWGALIVAGVCAFLADGIPALTPSREIFGAVFPLFLLGGVFAWADRRLPRWVAPPVLALAILRAILGSLGFGTRLSYLELASEVPLYLAAAGLAWVTTRRRESTAVERLLVPALLGFCGVEIWDTVREMRGLASPSFLLWATVLVPTGTIQFFCVLERAERARAAAQREASGSEARFRLLAEQTRDVISEVDSEGRLVYVSPNVRESLGWAEDRLVGRKISEIAEEVQFSEAQLVYDEGVGDLSPTRPFSVVAQTRDRDGEPRWVETRAHRFDGPDGRPRAIAVTRDVTERVLLEEKLLQTQKLESLGQLAGGIAHDFNNLLVSMLGSAGVARRQLPEGSPARGTLAEIETAAERAAELTQQLLAYAGRVQVEVRPLDVSALVGDVAALLETGLPPDVELHLELSSDLPAVLADATQLRQVLMNLVSNAADAMGGKAGWIVLRTRLQPFDAEDLAAISLCAGLEAGDYLVVECQDSGAGMDEATRARAFDPFFSTRAPGRGLGLSALLGIVRRHGGGVDLATSPGAGTTLRILLPTSDLPAEPEREPAAEEGEWLARGTVLVVDDEEGVRNVARQALEMVGFTVLCAQDGREGLELFRKHASQVVAVLLDLTMPGEPGPLVLAQLRAVDPRVRVILSSGYAEEDPALREVRGFAGYLQKPYRLEALVEKVRGVIAS